MQIGAMAMPLDFKYKRVFEQGRPQHVKWDPFYMAHPPMSASNWAKIFSPFDALKGFNEEIRSKEIVYSLRRTVDEDELGRVLADLHNLTWNGRMARQNRVMVNMTYFSPAYGDLGLYHTASGMVLNVDPDVLKTITLQTDQGKLTVPFSDIQTIKKQEEQHV